MCVKTNNEIFLARKNHCCILLRDHRQVILNYSLVLVHVSKLQPGPCGIDAGELGLGDFL